jgi:protein-disulfide isomerase
MNMLIPPVSETDHIRGAADALVTLVEYGDFECPHCGRAHVFVLDALERLGDDVRFVFRHFPLAQAHPHAPYAAEAAEAAGEQGRFWPMHDVLFENQDALESDDLVAYADELELDVKRFVDQLEAGIHQAKVQADFRSGVRSGVNGTPTFFIDGQRFDGSWADGDLVLALASVARGKQREVSTSPAR